MMALEFNFPTKQETKDRLAKGYRKRREQLLAELFSTIVLATPVRYGEARGGWQVSVGGPASHSDGGLDPDGMATIVEGLASLRGASPFAQIWISNPVKHVQYLENGWSTQAPYGMVKVALAAWKAHHAGEVS